MPAFDKTHVKICGCIVVYDGITRPEALEDNQGFKWNVKVVIPANSPDIGIADQMAREELLSSEFKGHLPHGGIWPIAQIHPSEPLGQLFAGYYVMNCSTYRQPDVYDEHGQPLQPMQYGALMYNGQFIDVLVNFKAYNKVSKGIAARLDAFQIHASKNAPRLAIGGGSIDSRGAFGATGAAPAAAPGGYPPAAAPGGYPPAAAPGGYPPAAAPGGYPPAAAPGGYPPAAAPGGYPPAAAPGGYPPAAAPGGYPGQAHDFLQR